MSLKDRAARNAYNRKRYAERADVREKTRERLRKWRNENPRKLRAQNKRAHAVHRVRDLARNRAWYQTGQAKIRARKGLPEPTRPRPLDCELCGGDNGKKALCYDHNHETMLFRGWLCAGCNTAIGRFGDNVAGVLRVLTYLRVAEPKA